MLLEEQPDLHAAQETSLQTLKVVSGIWRRESKILN